MKKITLKEFVATVTSQEVAGRMELRPATVRYWLIDGVPEKHRDSLKGMAESLGYRLADADLARPQ